MKKNSKNAPIESLLKRVRESEKGKYLCRVNRNTWVYVKNDSTPEEIEKIKEKYANPFMIS